MAGNDTVHTARNVWRLSHGASSGRPHAVWAGTPMRSRSVAHAVLSETARLTFGGARTCCMMSGPGSPRGCSNTGGTSCHSRPGLLVCPTDCPGPRGCPGIAASRLSRVSLRRIADGHESRGCSAGDALGLGWHGDARCALPSTIARSTAHHATTHDLYPGSRPAASTSVRSRGWCVMPAWLDPCAREKIAQRPPSFSTGHGVLQDREGAHEQPQLPAGEDDDGQQKLKRRLI
jgi:hypothetical protein